jgi:hypothetical protein
LNKNLGSRFEKIAKNEIEVHYLSRETKISMTRHKQHFEIHSKFNLWMVAKW